MTGNVMVDKIIAGLSALATAGCLGVFIYALFFSVRPLPNEDFEKADLLENGRKMVYSEAFKMDKMTINLKSQSRRLRFLDVIIYLVPFTSEKLDALEESKSQINDSVIDITSRMSPNDLNTIAGKILLEERIKKGVNRILHGPFIKEVYFSKFVVQ
ncbi:MAG: flagellar basal body-associated FliL family protein [Halobacteriovoraceae bacterium]|jgi:flagellar protein FliL|nr:flagellar basal body-associated FliL family protein [Halobacteriovoraceae bacterium]MBT5095883.1 flagellar basal body-associated FliL family protein [Halobacteriovoraceae bacterium]